MFPRNVHFNDARNFNALKTKGINFLLQRGEKKMSFNELDG